MIYLMHLVILNTGTDHVSQNRPCITFAGFIEPNQEWMCYFSCALSHKLKFYEMRTYRNKNKILIKLHVNLSRQDCANTIN